MGYDQYKKNSILTASKEQILLMLYEHAIKSCKLAIKAIEAKNVPDKCKQITKAHDIVLELLSTLDSKANAEIASQLESLYTFCSTQLMKANFSSDVKTLENVINILTTLYQGWSEAVRQMKKQGQ